MKRLLFLGAYNASYPRNSVIRYGLSLNGWEVIECNVGFRTDPLKQNVLLLQKFSQLQHIHFDAVLLAERGQYLIFSAKQIAERLHLPLYTDFLYSRFDTQCEKGLVAPRSYRGVMLWLFDWLSLHLSDHVLCDTKAQRDFYITKFKLKKAKASVLYHGADTRIYQPWGANRDEKQTRVIFWGSYTPSHGVDTIVRSAHLLSSDQRLSFTLVGHGHTYETVRKLARNLEVTNVRFLPWMTQTELAGVIAASDIVIGAMGNTPKAMRSICFKEFQGLGAKKVVISPDTPAVKGTKHIRAKIYA